VPAMLNYVLEYTKARRVRCRVCSQTVRPRRGSQSLHARPDRQAESLTYVGHSQGATVGLAAFLKDPALAAKVKLSVALAPVTTLKGSTSIVVEASPASPAPSWEACRNPPGNLALNGRLSKTCKLSRLGSMPWAPMRYIRIG